MIKKLIFIYYILFIANTIFSGTAEVALKAFEETLGFVKSLTETLATEKLERERLKKELIELARENTDIKLNQAIKTKNMVAIIKLKVKLLLYINLYSQYVNSINVELQNTIDTLFKQIQQLSIENLNLFHNTKKKELLSSFNYILDDGFSNYFILYEQYFTALSKTNTAFNPYLQNSNTKSSTINNTIKSNPIFIDQIDKIIIDIKNRYNFNEGINIHYKQSVNELRNYFSSIFFTATDIINKKIEELLQQESSRALDQPCYDLTLTIARIDAILFSKIDIYMRTLEDLDDNCYKMYFILKKILIESSWITDSLKNNRPITDDINQLKNIIQNIESQNQIDQKKFTKKISIKNEYFESLLKKLNTFNQDLINHQQKQDKINFREFNKSSLLKKIGNLKNIAKKFFGDQNNSHTSSSDIFKGNIDPDKLLTKYDDIINLIQKEVLDISKKKDYFTNKLSLLYYVNLTEEDLFTNIEVYNMIQKKERFQIEKLQKEEKERLEKQKLEKEQERLEKERLEKERLHKEEQTKLEQEQKKLAEETNRLKQEKLNIEEQMRLEKEQKRLEQEKLEKEKLHKEEQTKLEQEQKKLAEETNRLEINNNTEEKKLNDYDQEEYLKQRVNSIVQNHSSIHQAAKSHHNPNRQGRDRERSHKTRDRSRDINMHNRFHDTGRESNNRYRSGETDEKDRKRNESNEKNNRHRKSRKRRD